MHRNPDVVAAFAAIVAALAAVVGIIVTVRYDVTQLHADQRAWLAVDTVDVVPLKEGSRFQASIRLKNEGRTPARNLTISQFVTTASSSSPVKPNSIPKAVIQTLLRETDPTLSFIEVGSVGPQSIFLTNALSDGPSLNSSQIEELKDGKWTYFVRSKYEYEDVFGLKHETDDCYYLVFNLDGTPFMNVCPTGNDLN